MEKYKFPMHVTLQFYYKCNFFTRFKLLGHASFSKGKILSLNTGAADTKSSYLLFYPTDHFTVLELQNKSSDVPELHKIRRSPDLETLKS